MLNQVLQEMYIFRKLSNFAVNRLSQNRCCKFKLSNTSSTNPGFYIHTASKKYEKATDAAETNVLVYKAPLKTRIKVVKYLSLSTSMLGAAFYPTVINDLCKVNVLLGCVVGTVSIFFLSTPFMLQWITKRYVLELYYDTKTHIFTATTFNIINQTKEIKFQANDVTVPDLPGVLSSFLVNGKPLFVDATMIQDPDAYSHMMGYDKPFDFDIKIDEQNGSSKTA